jgi:hypothetical protein
VSASYIWEILLSTFDKDPLRRNVLQQAKDKRKHEIGKVSTAGCVTCVLHRPGGFASTMEM